jgi:hypothetical protein
MGSQMRSCPLAWLEKCTAGSAYHGVAELGVPFREIAEVIGRRLKLPVITKTSKEAAGHFNWLASFVATDNPVSSQSTQKNLGWQPTDPALFRTLNARATSSPDLKTPFFL